MAAEHEDAVAMDMIIGRGDSRLDRSQRDGGLEGRAGRIGAAHHLVEQGLVVVGGQPAPLFPRQTDIEQVGVEARRGRQRDHIAIGDVHDNAGGAFACQLFAGHLLHLAVDGQPYILSRRSGVLAQLADDAAIGIDLDAGGAGGAAHILFIFALYSALADAIAWQRQQRIVIALQFLGRDGGDIAQDVHHLRPEGIVTGLAHIGLNSRQIGQMQVDAGEVLPAQILDHRHRHELLVHGDVVHHLFFLLVGEEDHLADIVQRICDAFGRLLGHQKHAIIAPVAGQFGTEAVQDASARRHDQPLGNAVVFGLHHVLAAVADLQLVEAAGQDGKNRRHASAHAGGAAGEGGVTALVLLVEERHQMSLRNGPTRRRCSQPIKSAVGA